MDVTALARSILGPHERFSRAPIRRAVVAASDRTSCSCCVFSELGLCVRAIATENRQDARTESGFQITPTFKKLSARQRLLPHRDDATTVSVVCDGWAVSYQRLPSEKRQITSVLLSGSMPSSFSLMVPSDVPAIEMITEVTLSLFPRAAIDKALKADDTHYQFFSLLFREERQQLLDLVIDLGRRSPIARIARLVLTLSKRLALRGACTGNVMRLPLRQHHIADIVGVTTIHACRLIGKMESMKLIEINHHQLRILDPNGLRDLAEVPMDI